MKVTMVNAGEAEAMLDARLARAGPGEALAARRLVALFHGRHVGLPPAVALRFAHAFAGPRRVDPDDRLRASLHARLLAALGRAAGRLAEARQVDHLPRSLMVEACLLPLSGLAAVSLGETVLFSSTDGFPRLDAAAYDRHEAEFGRAIDRLLEPPADDAGFGPLEIFWERAAHMLWSSGQRPPLPRDGPRIAAGRAGRDDVLRPRRYEPDGMVLRYVCGLDPDVAAAIEPSRVRLDLVEEPNPLMSHPRQGGVVDIHTTRRIEDIEDIVLAELIYPPAILLDKVLNEGFLAKKRPPPLDEHRPVLVVGLAVGRMDRPAAAFAKVAWLDAVFRFAILLYKAGLTRSQLRFAEWLPRGGATSCRVDIGSQPVLEHYDPRLVRRSEMRAFFRNAGWLPGFASRSPGAFLDEGPAANAGGGAPTQVRRRLDALVRLAAPELDAGPGADGDVTYRIAIATVFSQADPLEPEAPMDVSARDATLASATIRIEHPPSLDPGEAFVLFDATGRRTSLPVGAPGSPPLDKVALEDLAATLSGRIFDLMCGCLDG